MIMAQLIIRFGRHLLSEILKALIIFTGVSAVADIQTLVGGLLHYGGKQAYQYLKQIELGQTNAYIWMRETDCL